MFEIGFSCLAGGAVFKFLLALIEFMLEERGDLDECLKAFHKEKKFYTKPLYGLIEVS